MRRTSADTHNPRVGLVRESGVVTPHELDTSNEKWLQVCLSEQIPGHSFDEFLNELRELKQTDTSFEETMFRVLDRDEVEPGIRDLILKAMEKK